MSLGMITGLFFYFDIILVNLKVIKNPSLARLKIQNMNK